ncbi:MAG: DUF4124 domain-containing protein [Burkholderiales bacterium]
MRTLLVLLAASMPAHADLYRWVDPVSGSVNLSNVPPADPRIRAEIVPYTGAAAPKSAMPAAGVAALEAQFNALYAQLATVPPQSYRNAPAELREQMRAYEALRRDLDRADPAGAPRRAAASLALAQRVQQGLAGTK